MREHVFNETQFYHAAKYKLSYNFCANLIENWKISSLLSDGLETGGEYENYVQISRKSVKNYIG